MLSIDELLPVQATTVPIVPKKVKKPYKQHNIYNNNVEPSNKTVSTVNIDNILENEKQQNIKDTWNKLDKTVKIQKLNTYAIKYCSDNNSESYDVSFLMNFFKNSLENNKLQKKKDLVYDIISHEIVDIPTLFFKNNEFVLHNSDRKRCSTLKSLTPKRTTERYEMLV